MDQSISVSKAASNGRTPPARTGAYEATSSPSAPGCFVTYDLETIDILRGLLRVTENRVVALRRHYEEFRELHGVRPTAAEVYHAGYSPRAARSTEGSWLRLVQEMGDLDEAQARLLDRHGDFLGSLETTPMTKSYKTTSSTTARPSAPRSRSRTTSARPSRSWRGSWSTGAWPST